MRRRKNILYILVITVLLILGVGAFLYPPLAGWWNEKDQNQMMELYNEARSNTAIDLKRAAESYNEAIRCAGSPAALSHPEDIPGYDEMLDITGTGIMGTITIDKIAVDLPIYHGTGPDVLEKGAGHLEGSSLPTGGAGNHCVISGHCGLPSSKLFTDLNRLDIGDTFVLHVLDEDLIYEIDRIETVLPTEIEKLYLEEGKDYCTLMTCTPYGINTHRLLVRGHRIL